MQHHLASLQQNYRHNKSSSQHGFTIVELLIVIIVIAILAAMVTTAYTGIQNQAYDTTVRSDLSGVAKKLEIYRQQSAIDTYPRSIAELEAADIHATKSAYWTANNNFYYCASPTYDSYAIAGRSKSNQQYLVTNGSVSAPTTSYFMSNTCAAVGTTQVDAGTSYSGYVTTTGLWSTWVKD